MLHPIADKGLCIICHLVSELNQIFYRDLKFDEDFKKRLKIVEGWLKQRKTDGKNNETDEKTRDFITWIMSKGSL